MADEFAEFDQDLEIPDGETPTEEAPQQQTGQEGPTFVDPEPEGEQPAEDEPPAQEDPEPEPEPEKTVPYSRFEEEVANRRRLEERLDDLMRVALNRGEAPAGEAPAPEPDADVDPEVASLVEPIIERKLGTKLSEVEEILEERRQQQQLDRGEQKLPGFKEVFPEVQERYKALPDQEKAEYNNLPGALELAREILAERQAGRPSEDLENLKRRAHSEDVPNPQRGKRKQITARDIMSMSAEKFEAFKRAQMRGGYSDEDIDPLIR